MKNLISFMALMSICGFATAVTIQEEGTQAEMLHIQKAQLQALDHKLDGARAKIKDALNDLEEVNRTMDLDLLGKAQVD